MGKPTASDTNMKKVKFKERYNAWFPGAVTNLQDDVADRLIAGGFCEIYDKPSPVAEKEDSPAVVAPQKDSEPVAVSDNDDVPDKHDSTKRKPASRFARSKNPAKDS